MVSNVAGARRWYELQAKKWGTIAVSTISVSYFNQPNFVFYFLKTQAYLNVKLNCILNAFSLSQYLKNDQIDLRPLCENVSQMFLKIPYHNTVPLKTEVKDLSAD